MGPQDVHEQGPSDRDTINLVSRNTGSRLRAGSAVVFSLWLLVLGGIAEIWLEARREGTLPHSWEALRRSASEQIVLAASFKPARLADETAIGNSLNSRLPPELIPSEKLTGHSRSAPRPVSHAQTKAIALLQPAASEMQIVRSDSVSTLPMQTAKALPVEDRAATVLPDLPVSRLSGAEPLVSSSASGSTKHLTNREQIQTPTRAQGCIEALHEIQLCSMGSQY